MWPKPPVPELVRIALEGDHYKWRAMRANGVDERFAPAMRPLTRSFWRGRAPCPTRSATRFTTGRTWSKKRYFGIDELLDESSAGRIWDAPMRCWPRTSCARTAFCGSSASKPSALPTTPTDDLALAQGHRGLGPGNQVFPAFRPDKALNVHLPEMFNPWVARLEAASNTSIGKLTDLRDGAPPAARFLSSDGRPLSDHGLNHAYADFCPEAKRRRSSTRPRAGHAATPQEQRRFAANLMLFFGHLDAEKGWTKQLHVGRAAHGNPGARPARSRYGLDSIGDWPQADAAGPTWGPSRPGNALPKMVLYNLNPADNMSATMIGNFQTVPSPARFNRQAPGGSGSERAWSGR